MNRTLLVERLPVTGIRPGEVVIASGIAHPGRGQVGCPAAPLLAAAVARGEPGAGGRRVRLEPVAVTAGPADHDGAELVMASYLDRAGQAAGFGAAAPAGDPAAVTLCEELITRWAGVLRSRRLLVADADPDCAGAQAAVEAMLEASAHGPVYVIGQPVAAAGPLAELAARGVTIVADLDAVPDEAIVVFPAHGVRLAVQAEAAARGLRVVDATCPLVAMAHQDMRAYAGRGDTIALITGDHATAAEAASVSQAPETVLPVRSAAQAADLRRAGIDPDRLSLVVQTGIPDDSATGIIAALRASFPRVRGQHYDALCYAATDRAATIRQVASVSDLVLVLGSPGDPDSTQMLAEAARPESAGPEAAACRAVRRVASVRDIEAGWLAEATTIGAVLTRSTPPGLLTQVRDALSGLGPLTLVTRRTRTSQDLPSPARPTGSASSRPGICRIATAMKTATWLDPFSAGVRAPHLALLLVRGGLPKARSWRWRRTEPSTCIGSPGSASRFRATGTVSRRRPGGSPGNGPSRSASWRQTWWRRFSTTCATPI